jgi:hypothetical protein
VRAAYYLPISHEQYFALPERDRRLMHDALSDLIDELNEQGGVPPDER